MKYKIEIKRRGVGVRELEPVCDGTRPPLYVPTAFSVQARVPQIAASVTAEITASGGQIYCEAVTVRRVPDAAGNWSAALRALPLEHIIGLGVAEAAVLYGSGTRRARRQSAITTGEGRQRLRGRDVDRLAERVFAQDAALRLVGVKQAARVVSADLEARGERRHRNYIAALIERGETIAKNRSIA